MARDAFILNERDIMDVGQIISATTEPKNRDKDPYRNEDEDFASYVNEAAPKDESPIKEKSAGQNSGDAEEPAMTQNTAPESSVKDDSAPNEDVPASNSTPAAVDKAPASEKAAGTQVVDSTAASTAALPAPPVSAPAPTGTDVPAEVSNFGIRTGHHRSKRASAYCWRLSRNSNSRE